jgi:outer membrane protein assembly factor BamB
MFRRVLPIGVVLSIIAGSSARAQSPFPANLIPSRTALERLGLERQWFVVVPLVETERLLRISRTDRMLFAQTTYAKLHAYDAETGRRLWTAELGERTGFARGVAANTWAVFATNANTLFSIDRGSGRIMWKTNLGTIPTSTPACDESRVWVGMTNGLLMGFSLKRADAKGNELIRETPYPLPSWHAGERITTRPLPAQNVLAFGGGDRKVYVVMVEEPTVVFRVPTGGAIGEGLGAYGTSTVLIPSADFNLYAADLFTADILWTFPSGAPILQEPMVADKDIYVTNAEGFLTNLDPANGARRWTVPTQGGRLASVSATKLYLRSFNLDLFVIDRKTGRTINDPSETHLRAGLNLRDYDLDIVNRFNDRTCFATSSGMIISLREIGQTAPRPLRDPKQHAFGFIPPEGLKPAIPTTPAPAAPGEEPAAAPKEAAPKEAAPKEAAPKDEVDKPQ